LAAQIPSPPQATTTRFREPEAAQTEWRAT
jgi:hypothetical protein